MASLTSPLVVSLDIGAGPPQLVSWDLLSGAQPPAVAAQLAHAHGLDGAAEEALCASIDEQLRLHALQLVAAQGIAVVPFIGATLAQRSDRVAPEEELVTGAPPPVRAPPAPSAPPARESSVRKRGREAAPAPEPELDLDIEDTNMETCCVCDLGGTLLCCDRCPLSFHLPCEGSGLQDAPEGEWLCAQCIRAFGPLVPGSTRRLHDCDTSGEICTAFFDGPFSGPRARSTSTTLTGRTREELSAILCELREHLFSGAFDVPVDTSSLPEYLPLCPRPRDFGSISAKLSAGGYGTGASYDPIRIIGDLRLVTHNARVFNVAGSTIWRMADALFREFETALRDRVSLSPKQTQELLALRMRETPVQPRWEK